LAAIVRRGRLPVVVGGTGLYLRALFDGLFAEPPLDPARRARLAECLRPLSSAQLERWARRLDPGFAGGGSQRAARAIEVALLAGRSLSRLRAAAPATGASFTPWYARLALERDKLAERIASRVDRMLAAGLVEEVERLLAAGVPRSAPGFSAVGYREVLAFLDGRLLRAALGPAIVRASRRYAKRQETWFRHQLRGPVGDYDAAQGPETLARRVLADYGRDSHVGGPK
jgi:tRNA dimethylallyltransferase